MCKAVTFADFTYCVDSFVDLRALLLDEGNESKNKANATKVVP